MEVLKTTELSKRYGLVQAVNKLSFSVKKGEVLGVLGPNGSGKTTTLGMILGIIGPTEGNYSWFENDHSRPLLKVGSLLETPNHYPFLSGWDNLKITAHIKQAGLKELSDLIEMVGLSSRINHKVKTYSLGMKQRLAIASAMIGDPEVIIFDEPTNGLDPAGIAEIRMIIQQIAARGKTIIMASHILVEVEKTCTHCLILKNGQMISHGRVDQILKSANTFMIESDDRGKLMTAITGIPGYIDHQILNNKLMVTFEDSTKGSHINHLLFQRGVVLSHLSREKRKLEDAFIELLNGT
ncbi:MAG: ABC transporter ATP-binding protein [Saprospirales bacterium]|nr:MAG: ABC transporter ATP-binding protein [Saprospirales bacterium]